MGNSIIICNKYGDSTTVNISEILSTDIPSTNIAFKSYTSINRDSALLSHDYQQRVPLDIN